MSTEPRVPTSQLDTLSQLPSNATEDQVWIANLARDLLDAEQQIGNLENEVRILTAQLEAARLVNRQAPRFGPSCSPGCRFGTPDPAGGGYDLTHDNGCPAGENDELRDRIKVLVRERGNYIAATSHLSQALNLVIVVTSGDLAGGDQ